MRYLECQSHKDGQISYCQGLRGRGNGKLLFNGGSVFQDEKDSGDVGDDGYTTLWMNLLPLNYMLENE
jgi:hypothetical protein